MKWELNESKYTGGTAQTSSILKALHMEDEKRPKKTGSLNEDIRRFVSEDEIRSLGVDAKPGWYNRDSWNNDIYSQDTFAIYDWDSMIQEIDADDEVFKLVSSEFEESMQLSGTKKLNGRRNLRRGKENPDNIKTAGNKTKLTGDYDLRESYDDEETNLTNYPVGTKFKVIDNFIYDNLNDTYPGGVDQDDIDDAKELYAGTGLVSQDGVQWYIPNGTIITLVDQHGPSGGWPEISIDGSDEQLTLSYDATPSELGLKVMRTSKKRIKDIGIYDMDKVNEGLQESYDNDTFDEVTHMLYSCLEKIINNVYGARELTFEDLELMFEFAYMHLEDVLGNEG